MHKRIFFLLFLYAALLPASAQKTDSRLQQRIARLVSGFQGSVGVYVKDLKSGRVASVNADTIFPSASMVKVPILLGVMDGMAKGALRYDQPFEYRDSLLYEGVDILGSFKQGEKIELGKLLMLMLTMSDNTASLWLQSLAGTGTRINGLLDSLGFVHTRVNSRTAGREAERSAYGWGQTTPREMATLLERMAEGRLFNDSLSQRMLRLLSRNFWDDVALSQIPADVFVASKNGAVNASRSEVLFVHGRGARYVFCICTKNNRDQSWETNNEAWVLTKQLSRLLWEKYGR